MKGIGVILVSLSAQEITLEHITKCDNHQELEQTEAKIMEIIGTDQSMIWLANFESLRMNYFDAQKHCGSFHGNLWCPDRKDEYAKIVDNIHTNNFSWLGVKRVGENWVCDHHEDLATSPLEFTDWDDHSMMSFPSDNELFTTVFGFGKSTLTRGKWHNTNPLMKLGVVCQIYCIGQLVELVDEAAEQSESSATDSTTALLDDAASLLEKIEDASKDEIQESIKVDTADSEEKQTVEIENTESAETESVKEVDSNNYVESSEKGLVEAISDPESSDVENSEEKNEKTEVDSNSITFTPKEAETGQENPVDNTKKDDNENQEKPKEFVETESNRTEEILEKIQAEISSEDKSVDDKDGQGEPKTVEETENHEPEKVSDETPVELVNDQSLESEMAVINSLLTPPNPFEGLDKLDEALASNVKAMEKRVDENEVTSADTTTSKSEVVTENEVPAEISKLAIVPASENSHKLPDPSGFLGKDGISRGGPVNMKTSCNTDGSTKVEFDFIVFSAVVNFYKKARFLVFIFKSDKSRFAGIKQ